METTFVLIIVLLIGILVAVAIGCRSKASTDEFGNSKLDNVRFIHIPKTGGTSIVSWAEKNKLPWGRKDSLVVNDKCATNDGKWHCPSQFWNPGFDYFCVVRDPVDRMVSEANYENIVLKGQGKSKRITSQNVNAFLQSEMRKHFNTFREKAHYLPQSRYVFLPSGKKFCKTVLQFENLQSEFAGFMKTKGVKDARLERAMAGDKAIRRSHLSPQTIDLIHQIYDEDYKNFGYKKSH